MSDLQPAVIVLIGLASALFPRTGLLLLLSGYVLQDRGFAHWHLTTPWAPVYVTEVALAGFLLHYGCRAAWNRQWPFSRRASLWILFFFAAGQSFARGLWARYPFPEVVRDSALCYYALFALWTANVADEAWQRRELRILGALVLLRAFGSLCQDFGMTFLSGQPAAMTLYFSLGLIFLAAHYAARGSWSRMLAIGILPAAMIIFLQVRTGWVALGLVVFFALGAGCAYRTFFRTATNLIGILATGLIVAFLIAALPQSGITVKILKDEIYSLTMGEKSPNVKTRLHLWQDALEQLTVTGLARNPGKTFVMALPQSGLGESGVGRYYGPPDFRRHDSVAELSATHGGPAVDAVVINGGAIVLNVPALHASRWTRMILGIPFGYPFLPAREEGWLVTQRFDPHNSIIAWFYRTGFFGLVVLVAILVQSLKRGIASIGRAAPGSFNQSLLTASVLSVVYVLGHSLTDVTLENPFKGVFLWVFLGLLYRQSNPSLPPET